MKNSDSPRGNFDEELLLALVASSQREDGRISAEIQIVREILSQMEKSRTRRKRATFKVDESVLATICSYARDNPRLTYEEIEKLSNIPFGTIKTNKRICVAIRSVREYSPRSTVKEFEQ